MEKRRAATLAMAPLVAEMALALKLISYLYKSLFFSFALRILLP
jgi:hypothetical protein